jgi:hypothetical protein
MTSKITPSVQRIGTPKRNPRTRNTTPRVTMMPPSFSLAATADLAVQLSKLYVSELRIPITKI